jgi:hypothetical protein
VGARERLAEAMLLGVGDPVLDGADAGDRELVDHMRHGSLSACVLAF